MQTELVPRIVITPGEPAGIGPDVVVQIAQQQWPAELIVIADPSLLLQRGQQLKLPLELKPFDASKPRMAHTPSQLKIIPVTLNETVIPGKLSTANSAYVLRCLEIAADLCLKLEADALVTGPVHKAVINDAQIPFTGHTEFLAERCKADSVLMLFVTDKMKVALATTHIPLSQVAAAISKEKLIQTIRLLHAEFKNKFKIHQPRILVAGLNPHAGESGHLGNEEINIIEPALQHLKNENIHVEGPLPADTLFTEKYLANADAILAMYHDQALPVVKYQGFDSAVNVTLGLPIIRTSVDHGTALDLAGSGTANPGSLTAAIKLAIHLCFARS